MKKVISVVLLMLGVWSCMGISGTDAATRSALSCSLYHVQAAIDAANDGDIVNVPAGSSTWATWVLLNKSIAVIGAGVGKTNVTTNIAGGAGFQVVNGTNSWRISGFTFKGPGSGNVWPVQVGQHNSTLGCRNFRIDNCSFMNYGRPLYILGHCTGVVDHSSFIGGVPNQDGIQVRGENEFAWTKDTRLGTDDFVFIEDNLFESNGVDMGHVIVGVAGARWVFRYNTIKETNGGPIRAAFDAHGFCHGPGVRGARAMEVYENKFIRGCATASWARGMFIRGGTGVIYNNRFDETAGAYAIRMDMYHYRTYGCGNEAACVGVDQLYCDEDKGGEGWICQDQVGAGKNQVQEPLYVWGNKTQEGVLVKATNTWCVNIYKHVRENRDFYNYSAPKPGYVPYAYPHPLIEDINRPAPPLNLQVIQ